MLIFQLVRSPNHSHIGIKKLGEIEPADSRETSSQLTTKPQCQYAFLFFMDLNDRLSWVSFAVKRLPEVGDSIFTVCNYFCSCPSVLNNLPIRGGLTAFDTCGLPVLLGPGRVVSSLPVSSSNMQDPEPKVFGETTECTGSNDKNSGPSQKKVHLVDG